MKQKKQNPTISFTVTDGSGSPIVVMKIEKGKFYWKGEEVEDKYKIYERFNEWMSQAEHVQEKVVTYDPPLREKITEMVDNWFDSTGARQALRGRLKLNIETLIAQVRKETLKGYRQTIRTNAPDFYKEYVDYLLEHEELYLNSLSPTQSKGGRE